MKQVTNAELSAFLKSKGKVGLNGKNKAELTGLLASVGATLSDVGAWIKASRGIQQQTQTQTSSGLLQNNSTVPASRGRVPKAIRVTKSSDPDIASYTKLSPGVSVVVEEGEFIKCTVGDYRVVVKEFISTSDNILTQLRKRNTVENEALLMFVGIADALFTSCFDETRVDNQIVLPSKIVASVGMLLRLNSSSLSAEKKFLINKTECGLSFAEYHNIIHALNVVPEDIFMQRTGEGYKDFLNLPDMYKTIFDKLNSALGQYCPGIHFCLDDDIMLHRGKDVDQGYLLAQVNIRKGTGVILNTVVDSVLHLVKSLNFEGRTKSTPTQLVDSLKLIPGRIYTMDRGYGKQILADHLHQLNIGLICILNNSIRKGHPHSIVEATWANLDQLESMSLPLHSIISYHGVGMQTDVLRNNRGVMAVSVVNRTNKNDSGVLRFFLAGPAAEMASKLKHSFVRIHKPLPIEERRTLLINNVHKEDVTAVAIFPRLVCHAKIVTHIQGDSIWYLLRRLAITASSNFVIKGVLKHLGKNVYRTVWNILYKEGEEGLEADEPGTELSETGTTADDSLVFEPLPSSSSQPSLEEDTEERAITPSMFPDVVLGHVLAPHSRAETEEEETDEHYEQATDSSLLSTPAGVATTPAVDSGSVSDVNPSSTNSEAHSSRSQTDHATPPLENGTTVQPNDIEKLQQDLVDKLTLHHFVTQHKSTVDEIRGKAMEVRGREHSRKHHSFLKGLYQIGATTSIKAPHILSSLDLICMIDLSKLDLTPILQRCPELQSRKCKEELATVEFKCSKNFVPRPLASPEIVVAGSKEYHSIPELKTAFKSQMLQQAAVVGAQWNVLMAWSPIDIARVVIVYYPREALDQFIDLANHNAIKGMFSWFYDNAAKQDLTDDDLACKIPKFFSKRARLLWTSHIPLLRAIFLSASQRDSLSPFPPTHTFRSGTVALYDFLKGPTDVECRAYASAIMAGQELYRGRTKFVHRLFYTASISSCKMSRIRRYYDKVGGVLPEDIFEFWHGVNKISKINDMLYDLGGYLCTTKLSFGSSNVVTPVKASKGPVMDRNLDILAASPEKMIAALIQRAQEQHRNPPVESAAGLIQEYDFIGRFPASNTTWSSKTPKKLKIRTVDVDRVKMLEGAFTSRPVGSRKIRLKWWLFEGTDIRMNTDIWHCIGNVADTASSTPGSTRVVCIVCNKRKRVGKQSDKALECYLCGEHFCSTEHYNVFHSVNLRTEFVEKDEPLDEDEESSLLDSGTSLKAAKKKGAKRNSPSEQTETKALQLDFAENAVD